MSRWSNVHIRESTTMCVCYCWATGRERTRSAGALVNVAAVSQFVISTREIAPLFPVYTPMCRYDPPWSCSPRLSFSPCCYSVPLCPSSPNVGHCFAYYLCLLSILKTSISLSVPATFSIDNFTGYVSKFIQYLCINHSIFSIKQIKILLLSLDNGHGWYR